MGKQYWTFKTFENGLETVFRDYQILSMKYLWELGEEGAGSGKVWRNVNKVLKEKGKTISRASIIFFLNDMVDVGVLIYVERTGKGGYHRIYSPAFNENEFEEFLSRTIIEKISEVFPEATKTAIWKYQRSRS